MFPRQPSTFPTHLKTVGLEGLNVLETASNLLKPDMNSGRARAMSVSTLDSQSSPITNLQNRKQVQNIQSEVKQMWQESRESRDSWSTEESRDSYEEQAMEMDTE
jgi:hypothetical protein